jgi:hypothetical protein
MTIHDPFNHVTVSMLGPYTAAVAVTPSDSADLATRPRALLATTGAGTVIVHMPGQSSPVTLYLALGVPFPVRVDRVLTGGAATGIVGLW